MNWDEARQFAERVKGAWPTSRIPPGVWAENLSDCQSGAAFAVLARMVKTQHTPPSVAQVLQAYNALVVPDAEPAPVDCPWCDGTGVTSFVRLPALGPNGLDPGQLATIVRYGHRYEVAIPCQHCPASSHRGRAS